MRWNLERRGTRDEVQLPIYQIPEAPIAGRGAGCGTCELLDLGWGSDVGDLRQGGVLGAESVSTGQGWICAAARARGVTGVNITTTSRFNGGFSETFLTDEGIGMGGGKGFAASSIRL